MMDWLDDIDEKKQQQWQSRVARERLDLSTSVEEALTEASSQEDQESDEVEEDVPAIKKTTLIPPRLSLQSKQMPTVSRSVKVRTDHLPLAKAGAAIPRSTEGPGPTQNKHRTPRRTTKVRLQVVPKPEAIEKPVMTGVQSYEVTTNPSMPAVDRLAGPVDPRSHEVGTEMSGSGQFEKGQSEIMVVNAHITASSVVIVVLTADPGPVVVQYVTLHPQVGFTVHLSAATRKAASFNYRIS
jgi:hypothetical protein